MRRGSRRGLLEEELNLWPAFTDLMTNMAIIVFFIMLLAFVQNIISLQQAKESSKELENIVGVREKIKQVVEEGFKKEIGEGKIRIGPGAKFTVEENIVFDSGRWQIKPEGQEVLGRLGSALQKILDDEAIRGYIELISVEGHTDNEGSADVNWELSARRATGVIQYMHSRNPALATKYAGYFGATGFSEFKPVASNDTEPGRQQNRRIEFRVYLKDEKILNQVVKTLGQ